MSFVVKGLFNEISPAYYRLTIFLAFPHQGAVSEEPNLRVFRSTLHV